MKLRAIYVEDLLSRFCSLVLDQFGGTDRPFFEDSS